MGWRPALQRWTRCGQLQIISVLKAEHFQKFQVGVLMALAVAREGKQPTSLFGNLPGGSQLTLWYLDDLWIGLGWVGLGPSLETSLTALSSHSDIWMDLDWVGYLKPPWRLPAHSLILCCLMWIGLGWVPLWKPPWWLPTHTLILYMWHRGHIYDWMDVVGLGIGSQLTIVINIFSICLLLLPLSTHGKLLGQSYMWHI